MLNIAFVVFWKHTEAVRKLSIFCLIERRSRPCSPSIQESGRQKDLKIRENFSDHLNRSGCIISM